MKITVEIPEPGKKKQWRQFHAEVLVSHRNNYYFKHNGEVYVFKKLEQGCKVLTLNAEKKWVICGRVSHGNVFLGDPNEQSSGEYTRSPQGIEESKRLWESYKADLGLWKT
jgi:hypothetical protein